MSSVEEGELYEFRLDLASVSPSGNLNYSGVIELNLCYSVACCSNSNCPLSDACDRNDFQRAKITLEQGSACTLNILLGRVALSRGDSQLIQLLIEYGATRYDYWFRVIEERYEGYPFLRDLEADSRFLITLLSRKVKIPHTFPLVLAQASMDLGVPRVTFRGIYRFAELARELDDYQAQVIEIFSYLLPPELAEGIAAFFP